jgi:hypothetical protein
MNHPEIFFARVTMLPARKILRSAHVADVITRDGFETDSISK